MTHPTLKSAWRGLLQTAVILLALGHLPSVANEPEIIPIWPDGVPDSNGLSGPEIEKSCIGNISVPDMRIFRPAKNKATGAAVVMFPGGGYKVVCYGSEGVPMAKHLLERGITVFVVKYRIPNKHHTIPANDARRAIRMVRADAKKYGIDPNQVGVMGFSAGGHLSTTVSTLFDNGDSKAENAIDKQSSRPDFAIHIYPVVSFDDSICHKGSRNNLVGDDTTLYDTYSNEKNVTADTPPTFLLHCSDDRAVPVQNSLRFYEALVKHKVPAACQIFEKGGHGPNAYNKNPEWAAALDHWLEARGCLKAAEGK